MYFTYKCLLVNFLRNFKVEVLLIIVADLLVMYMFVVL
jgi:hypothetical protein